MPHPVILDAVRSPFARVGGAYRDTRPDVLLAQTLAGLTERIGVSSDNVEDVVVGCVSQVAEQGANIARLAVLQAGFPVSVPAVTLNRWQRCSRWLSSFAPLNPRAIPPFSAALVRTP